MEKELADYISIYCHEFYNEKERKANDHYFGRLKYGHLPGDAPEPFRKLKERMITDDPEVIQLLESGYAQFMQNTAERIYRDHKSELKLNLCPKCHQIARTPKAKQCRFCGHDWHS